MKKIAVVMLFGVLAFLVTGCDGEEAYLARKEAERVERQQSAVDKIITDILYIKDKRTGVCFAYGWGGSGNGGPAIATVPCEMVPFELLTVAK